MAIFYLSMTQGLSPYTTVNVTEGGSAPTNTSVLVTLNATVSPALTRGEVRKMLQAIENYIAADAPTKGGANNITILP